MQKTTTDYYSDTFKFKEIIKYTLLLIILYIFNYPINLLVKKYICNILFKNFDSYTISSVFAYAFFIYSVCLFTKNIATRKFISINSLIVISISLIVYIIRYRSESNGFKFISFFFYENIYIIDVLLICISFVSSKYIHIKSSSTEKYSIKYELIEDNSEAEIKDELFRENYAREIAAVINGSNTQKSFSIAVTSEWGNGKTVFIKYITKYLLPERSIVLYFEPWKYETINQSLTAFLEELEKELKNYDNEAASLIHSYTKRLSNIESTKLLSFSVGELLFYDDIDTPKRVKKINEIIDRIGKKIIVIIDDLDRLTKAELLHVFSIVRNYLDFNNVFFIAAFDKKYVNKQLADLGSGSENYTNKIFQLEVSLPPISRNFTITILKDYISRANYSTVVKQQMNLIIQKLNIEIYNYENKANAHDELLISPELVLLDIFFRNIRDVKRFLNSYNIAYIAIGMEIEINDLFLLELIKYKFYDVYILLAKGEILTWSQQNTLFNFDDKKFDESLIRNNISLGTFEKIAILKVMKILFINREMARSISKPRYYHLYFNYQLLGVNSIIEYNRKIYSDREELINYLVELIETSVNNSDSDELIKYLFIIEQVSYFENKEIFENIIYSLIFIYFNFNDIELQNSILKSILNCLRKIDVYDNYNDVLSIYNESLNNSTYSSTKKITALSELSTQISYSEEFNYKQNFIDFTLRKVSNLFEGYLNSNSTNEEDVYNSFVVIRNNPLFDHTSIINIYIKYLTQNNKYFLSILFEEIKYLNLKDLYAINPIAFFIFKTFLEIRKFVGKIPQNECTKYVYDKLENVPANGEFYFPDFDNNYPCFYSYD